MRAGVTVICQNYGDWDRYEAAERGESVPDRPAIPDRQIFQEEVGHAVMADELGFDSVWTIEHHFTPYTMVTNPLQLLTYLAGRTQNVDLGTMVIVLPWHNPVRVAEDIAMLDSLLGDRRVIAGVGRGLGRREYAGLGIDQNEARGRFDEGVEIIRELLATGECTFHGEHFDVEHVRLRPQPGKDISDSLYCAAGSPETMAVVAEKDIKPLIIPTSALHLALGGAQNYMRLRGQAGLEPVSTKLALWTYCGETEQEATEAAERYMLEYTDSALRHYELGGEHFDNLTGYKGYAKMAEMLRKNDMGWRRSIIDGHPWGTPGQIIDKVSDLARKFGTSEISFVFRYGSMPQQVAEKSLRLFAEEVLPALHELETEPMVLDDAA
jgi:alkanesulfonate monooxygenase SsuD/methylene tetrahydromethanopterin reductase-like flavin-dependent oxidoreductase (luciferase family)